MRMVALNPGEQCSWATWDGRHLGSGVEEFQTGAGNGPGKSVEDFGSWLEAVSVMVDPELYVCEDEHQGLRLCPELVTDMRRTIEQLAAREHVGFEIVVTKDLEKWATGKVNPRDEDILGELSRRYEVDVPDVRQARAVLLIGWKTGELG